MRHHKESPQKPQYNMETAPFLDKLPHFVLSPLFHQYQKRWTPPPLIKGGEGFELSLDFMFVKYARKSAEVEFHNFMGLQKLTLEDIVDAIL